MEHPGYHTGVIELADDFAHPMLSDGNNVSANGIRVKTDFRLNEALHEKHGILNHTLNLKTGTYRPRLDTGGGRLQNSGTKGLDSGVRRLKMN